MRSVLVVVDAQNYFINRSTKAVARKIAEFIRSRRFDFTFFFKFINSEKSNFVQLSNWRKMFYAPDIDITFELKEFLSSNQIFKKSSFSVFKSKELADFLKGHTISRIFLCGFDTDACILASAFEAFDLGFEVRVIEDLCASHHGVHNHKTALEIFKANLIGVLVNSKDILAKKLIS